MTSNISKQFIIAIPSLFGFVLPISIFFSNYLFALMSIALIFYSQRRKTIEWLPMIIIAIPAIIPLAGIFIHKESFNFLSLEVRIPFLVIAFIIGFFKIDFDILRNFKIGLIFGSMLSAVLILASHFFLDQDLTTYPLLDLSYASLFIVVAIIFIWYTQIQINNVYKITITILFLIILLILAKPFFVIAGYLVAISALIVKGSALQSKISVALLVIIAIILLYQGPSIQNFVNQYQQDQKLDSSEKFAQWQCVLEVMENNELVGISYNDRKETLIDCYRNHGMTKAENMALNAHNEYLDFYLILGYIGILAIMIFFMNAFFVTYDFKEVAHLLIIILIALFSLTENVFTRQKGVMITSITYMLIYASRDHKVKNRDEEELLKIDESITES